MRQEVRLEGGPPAIYTGVQAGGRTLTEESERSVAAVARDLGIHLNNLCKWQQALATVGPEAFPGHGNLRVNEAEVQYLQRVLDEVRQERDILKEHCCTSRRNSGEVPVHL